MTHDVECPARYGCCARDLEMSCAIHVEPPYNCPVDNADPAVLHNAGSGEQP